MDSEAFMAGLSERDKVIIQFIVQGKPLAILARRRHLNSSTMLYHKERLALKIQNFMGKGIGVIPRTSGSRNIPRQQLKQLFGSSLSRLPFLIS